MVTTLEKSNINLISSEVEQKLVFAILDAYKFLNIESDITYDIAQLLYDNDSKDWFEVLTRKGFDESLRNGIGRGCLGRFSIYIMGGLPKGSKAFFCKGCKTRKSPGALRTFY